MAIKKVGLSWISISDFAKAKKFFTETLGLSISELNEQYSWMELAAKTGGPAFGVGAASEDKAAGTGAVITFEVDNFDTTVKELTKKGIKFFGEISGFPGVPRMINFKDEDGNMFQLVEEQKK